MLKDSIKGAGIGLRLPHAQEILRNNHFEIPWFEVLVDNWMVAGGLNKDLLFSISERYPLVFHSVGLSLGGMSPLDRNYMAEIKSLKQATGAHWYSEHVSFSGNASLKVPDLLPLPYTEEAVKHMSQRIIQVQDFFGERILIENVSAYVSCAFDQMNEGAFLSAVTEEADCYLLLDINNAYVNSVNLNLDLGTFFSEIPVHRVKQIHLAGFEDKGEYLLDAHNNTVSDEVWKQFKLFVKKHGAIPSMIEWDNDLPSLENLLRERNTADIILNEYKVKNQERIIECV